MTAELAGRTALVTGAGRGIGRAAERVADEIRARGGRAAANTDSVADWDSPRRAYQTRCVPRSN